MNRKVESHIIGSIDPQPPERVQAPTYPRTSAVSPQLIQTVQEMPLTVFLYDPSAAHVVASSKAAKATFEPTEHVLDIFADSDPKTHLKMSEKSGHNLDDLNVPLQGDQGYATATLRHVIDHATHLILLYLTAFSRTQETEFDLSCLTPRERDIVELLIMGNSNEQIATGTGLTGGTVYNHISRICEKVGVSDRTQVVAKLKK